MVLHGYVCMYMRLIRIISNLEYMRFFTLLHFHIKQWQSHLLKDMK